MAKTVLIADDNEPNRELVHELLRNEGLNLVDATDGNEAIEEFARTQPDLVLLDVKMPGLDGFEVCRQLKNSDEHRLVPVVLITALSATEDRVRGLEAGADDFLTKPVDKIELLARVRSLLSLKAHTDELERAESVLLAMARIVEGKDPLTEGHCARLSDLGRELGERLGLPAELITALNRAGTVHDIGKIAVPDAILLKSARLNAEELAVMRQHPVVGERICAALKSFRLVLPIIRHHHEKRDGSGYPDGLMGDQIPLSARVLQVVDVYDALTSVRPYKRALSQREAFAVMDDEIAKGWWDPHVFHEFRELLKAREPAVTSQRSSDASICLNKQKSRARGV